MPVRRSTSLIPGASSSMYTPSSLSTSALPHADDTARLPCLATDAPAPAATIAATVDTLNVPRPSPPVPEVSTMRSPSTVSGVTRARMASAAPVISSAVSPFIRSATSSALFCTSEAWPSITSPNTSAISSRSRCCRSITLRIALSIMAALQEVDDDAIAAGGAVRLGMELDSEKRPRAMADGHDHAVLGLGIDAKKNRRRRAIDNQRVIARRLHRRRASFEQSLAAMPHRRDLAVHRRGAAHDARAERLAERLMTEADAEQRNVIVETDEIEDAA